MLRSLLLASLLFLLPLAAALAQPISGRVTDARTGQALAFVNIGRVGKLLLLLMRTWLLRVVCLLLGSVMVARGQAAYVGTVGLAPIELALDSQAEGSLTGTYLYTRVGTPITLTGQLKQGRLTLTEKNAHRQPTASLTIPAFTATTSRLSGTWRDLATSRTLPVVLGAAPGRHALLQTEALPAIYFKTVLAGGPGSDQVVAVQLLAKRTNRLVQQVAVDCESHGCYSVSVGDFNFDGRPDFAVFESSYAGPNTTSLYYLYDPAKKRYVPSGFEGTSLEFDARKRRVYEHNSCCAGSSLITIEYKVLRNKLVQVARHCLRWDDKKQEFVARPFRDCQ